MPTWRPQVANLMTGDILVYQLASSDVDPDPQSSSDRPAVLHHVDSYFRHAMHQGTREQAR